MDPPHPTLPPLHTTSSPPRPSQHLRPPPSDSTSPLAAAPVSIPGAASMRVAAPPPLPPPSNMEELGVTNDPVWSFSNNWQGFAKSDSGTGRPRLHSIMTDPRDTDVYRRDSTFTVVPHKPSRDGRKSRTPSDGEAVPPAVSPSYSRLQSERQLEKTSLDTSSQQYDRNLLSKIGGPNTPLRMHSFSSSTSDTPAMSPSAQNDARGPAFKRLSIPERRRSSVESRFSTRNNSSASSIFTSTSFRSNSIFLDPAESRSSYLKRHPSLHFDDSSHRGSYDGGMLPSPMEEGPMRDLCLSDRSPGDDTEARAGMKRRASSPTADHARSGSMSPVPGYLEGARRSIYQLPPRSAPANRIQYPTHSSISSASSMTNRTASMASMASSRLSIASSITSFGSNLLNPSILSPLPAGMESEHFPYPTSKSLNPSPRSSVCPPPPFARHSIDHTGRQNLEPALSQSATPTASHVEYQQHPHAGAPGVLICDCCPKKPKKFLTEEDLRLHHMEKQYTCLYCPNRFKNKNEAERHQNSLHLRMHSWSCAALPSVEAAFHAQGSAGTSDACGYCGEEFRNNPPDWAARRAHLGLVHKYGECNQMKKFFRADHFRQHLKHSHAGTSGKWTNILENACMRDEPPPVPMQRGPAGQVLVPQHDGFAQQAQIKPQTIDELPQER